MRNLLSLAAVALLLTGGWPASAASTAKPSFDCRKASEWSEKAICADRKLARLDRAIDERFVRAMKGFAPGPARAALRADQTAFLGIRDGLVDNVDWDAKADMAERMADRAAFLGKVEAPAPGDFAGTWGNAWGQVQMRPQEDGTFRVVGVVTEPFTARWTCGIEGFGMREGAAVVVPADDDGVGRLVARQEGGVLVLDGLVGSDDVPPSSSYCGNLASMETAFFRIGPVSAQEPE